MRFDTTINVGNIVAVVSFLFLGIMAWRDMSWRVKNLETWRAEHMIDADARDRVIDKMRRILDHVRWQSKKMGGVENDIEGDDEP